MTVRKYSSRSQQTTLSSPITATATTMTVVNGASIMGGKTLTGSQTYTVVIDPDTALEEIVDVTVYSSGNTLTITRGIDGPTPGTGSAHSAGAVVRHMAIGRDYQEANDHIENSTTAHGLTLANVVKTTDTGTVSGTMIATGAVGSVKIDNAAVVEAKIGTAAVTTTKIADLNVTTGKLADSAVTSAKIANDTIVDADINSAAAITKTKISGTAITAADTGTVTSTMIADGTIVNGDINSAAAIDKTKISGTAVTVADTGTVTSTMIADGTIVNGDINSSAQIAYSKTNLTNSIVDADVNASAAIAWSKIAPSSTVSATELGYLDGVTSAVQTQLDSKLATSTAASTYAPLASPALTGVPTAPTAAANTNTTQVATTAYVQTEIADLIASAPGALDTLDELAAALGDDANFATTVTNNLATKLPLAGGTMSGAIAMGTNKITGLGNPTNAQDAATKYYIDNTVLAPSNLTGPITSVGNVTSIASQTGTGTKFVVDTSPTLVTPVLGVATATSINGTTIPSSKTLVATDSTAYVVPSQTGNSGKYLTTDGSTSSWGTPTDSTKVSKSGGDTITASGATVVPVVLKGAASQTGDLLQAQNSAGTSLVKIDSTGQIVTTTGAAIGYGASTATVNLEVGTSRTGDGSTNIDLGGDATYTDYGLRVARAAGANAGSSITSRGTGALNLSVTEAGAINFGTTNITRMAVEAGGNVNIGGSTSSNFNGLRYLDLYNQDGTTSASGVIMRLITQQSGSTSLTSVDMVKYKNGSFVIQNNDTAGTLSLGTGSGSDLTIDSAGATTVSYTTTTGGAVRNTWMSTSAPSGGADGDVWIQYT